MVDTLKKEGRKITISIVQSDSVNTHLYNCYQNYFDKVYSNDRLDLALMENDMALAASGTVTLACALFELPTIVTYRTSLLNEYIFKTYINYSGYISLANIVHQEEVFPELVGDNATGFNILAAMKLIIDDETCYNSLRKKLAQTIPMLSGESFDFAEYITSNMLD